MQPRLYASITKVTVPGASTSGGAPTLIYRMYTDAALTKATTCIGGGNTGYAPFTPNFTIAKLVSDTQNTGTQRWQSYINFSFENANKVATAEGGHDSYPGTLVDNGDGSCSYTYQADLSKVVAPSSTQAVTEPYEPNATTRFGMQNNPTDPNATHPAFNATFTVVPATGAIPASDPRELVTQEACDACHSQVAHHGAKRLSIPYCVGCHNQGTPDPDPGSSKDSLSLDMAVLIHRIHQGKNLPSVSLSDLTTPPTTLPPTSPPTTTIVINGTDYTAVGFPQSTGNCSVCHAVAADAGVTGGDYWKTQASIEACGACHDRTWFQASTPPAGFAQHTGGARTDGTCVTCHGLGTVINAAVTHPVAVPAPGAQAALLTVGKVTGAPGTPLHVEFSVTNPKTGAAQDLATDPLWTTAGARLAFDFAYSVQPGLDWTNSGSGATTGFGSTVPGGSPAPGLPLGFDVLAGIKASTVTKNPDGGYSFTTSYNLPGAAVGSGVAVLEGHPEDGTTEVPVRTATLPFAITDATATARRTVVDIQKCDACHGMLVLHGANRTDNIQACVACHNGEATDVTQRPQPAGTLGIDGKTEQSIDFAAMIHGIHTSQLVVYSFTGTPPGVGPANPTDYRSLMFPEGNAINHCDICHSDKNPFPATDSIGIVNGLTQLTGGSADQASYRRTTRATAVCSSCHSDSTVLSHMLINGGGVDLTQAAINSAKPGAAGVESCDVCHGAGAEFDPAQFHNVP